MFYNLYFPFFCLIIPYFLTMQFLLSIYFHLGFRVLTEYYQIWNLASIFQKSSANQSFTNAVVAVNMGT